MLGGTGIELVCHDTIHMEEQSQSVTSKRAGATTSNLTRPQWQPPVCVTIGAVTGAGGGSFSEAWPTPPSVIVSASPTVPARPQP